jgi:hypothetical protein
MIPHDIGVGARPDQPARGRTAPVGIAHGDPTQREQVQPCDQRQRIHVQGAALSSLAAVIRWGRNWYLGVRADRQHGLTSMPRKPASTLVSLLHLSRLRSAKRLRSSLGYLPPAEFEAAYFSSLAEMPCLVVR